MGEGCERDVRGMGEGRGGDRRLRCVSVCEGGHSVLLVLLVCVEKKAAMRSPGLKRRL